MYITSTLLTVQYIELHQRKCSLLLFNSVLKMMLELKMLFPSPPQRDLNSLAGKSVSMYTEACELSKLCCTVIFHERTVSCLKGVHCGCMVIWTLNSLQHQKSK